ncbi:MAG: SUMF1/EgtB/PvdO family nonheme iron enzyme, partial [Candidatus Poribacteria bacterium]|nr:SUMF1/EgtB/PvdO family nonheme iron enzyme [Candidatus Poribacteria bacterium]
WGNDESLAGDYANYGGTSGRDKWKYTAPVGSFKSSGYGLHDMAGNVWEYSDLDQQRLTMPFKSGRTSVIEPSPDPHSVMHKTDRRHLYKFIGRPRHIGVRVIRGSTWIMASEPIPRELFSIFSPGDRSTISPPNFSWPG